MPKSKTIAGIELGSSKISTLVAQVESNESGQGGGISIIGVSSVNSTGIKKGQIVNIEEAVEATIACIESAERMSGCRLESAFVAIGGATIFSQNSHGVVAVANPDAEITDEDINRVIEAASAVSIPNTREIIHVLPRDYIVDGEKGVRDPIGMSGTRLEVDTHIVSVSLSSVKNLKKAMGDVGIRIDGLVFSGLASSEAAMNATEKELGCCLIDIGGGMTSIAAFIDGSLCYSGVIPIGAKNVTNDLAIGLRVSLETAEKIKLFLSDKMKSSKSITGSDSDILDLSSQGISELKSVSRKTLVEGIIRPRLNEIFTMVRIDLDKAGIGNSIPAGAIITGGGANTVGTLESAKRMLALPVRMGLPTGISGLIDDIIDPAFSVPIGLIIYGAKNDIAPVSNNNSFMKKIKLPTKGIAGKILLTIKDLLP